MWYAFDRFSGPGRRRSDDEWRNISSGRVARARELLEGFLVEYGLAPGDRLPSERALSQRWGLSRSTLRNALSLMEEDGTLRSRIGAGTFVAPAKYTRSLQGLLSMSQSAAGQGRTVTTRLLRLEQAECDKHLAKRFGQMLGYPLYKSCACARWMGSR